MPKSNLHPLASADQVTSRIEVAMETNFIKYLQSEAYLCHGPMQKRALKRSNQRI